MEYNWTLTLADGTTIKNIGMNGSMFTSPVPVDEEAFKNNLSPFKAENTKGDKIEYNFARLGYVYQQGDEWWIPIEQIMESEIRIDKLEADVSMLMLLVGGNL